jgi:hypothetical protein
VSPFNDAFDADDCEILRRKRRPEISKFEKTQKFFAGQKPNTKKRLRTSMKESPSKKSAILLRSTIENIELEKLESDFPSCPNSKGRSQTPEKLKERPRDSLMGFSSNKDREVS